MLTSYVGQLFNVYYYIYQLYLKFKIKQTKNGEGRTTNNYDRKNVTCKTIITDFNFISFSFYLNFVFLFNF